MNNVAYLEERWKAWFWGSDATFDMRQMEFTEVVRAAGRGELEGDAWNTPRGLLAQIIIMDQFARCCFRGRPEAFAYEGRAETLAELLVTHGMFDTNSWNELLPVERFFVTMPFQHRSV